MKLDPVMSVHARVTRVAHPAMGEGVGYGFTYRVPRTRVQICTLPIGYADGLSRTLSNRMDVLYRGERIRQVGNICMDQFMVAIQSNPAHEIPEAMVMPRSPWTRWLACAARLTTRLLAALACVSTRSTCRSHYGCHAHPRT